MERFLLWNSISGSIESSPLKDSRQQQAKMVAKPSLSTRSGCSATSAKPTSLWQWHREPLPWPNCRRRCLPFCSTNNPGPEVDMRQLLKCNRSFSRKFGGSANRPRRNNMQIIVLPETVLQSQLAKTCTMKLPEGLEQARRLGPPRSDYAKGERVRPWAVIAKYLDYTALLQAFKWANGPVSLRGRNILVFGDYSAEVTRMRRRAFSTVCSNLVNKQVRFSLQFPANLSIFKNNGELETFESPDEAAHYLNSLSHRDGSSSISRENHWENDSIVDRQSLPSSLSSSPSRKKTGSGQPLPQSLIKKQ